MTNTTKAKTETSEIPTTTILGELPADIKPARKARELDPTIVDLAADAANSQGTYRLTATTDEASQKAFRRMLNRTVAQNHEGLRSKIILHENGVYWTLYTPRPRKSSDES